MVKRNSIKQGKQTTEVQGKVSATIIDLYSLELGKPPIVCWFLDFTYSLPRSPVVNHDWEEIRQQTIPTARQWANKLSARFDCVSCDSITKQLDNWMSKYIK